jgi:hypothetical protein
MKTDKTITLKKSARMGQVIQYRMSDILILRTNLESIIFYVSVNCSVADRRI